MNEVFKQLEELIEASGIKNDKRFGVVIERINGEMHIRFTPKEQY